MTHYDDACEARDAAVHNARAGNTDQAVKHAAMATMFLLFDTVEAGEAHEADATRSGRVPLPTHPGVYQDKDGIPWYRTAVETKKPWLDIQRAGTAYSWFTEEHAALFAPFTRMEVVA